MPPNNTTCPKIGRLQWTCIHDECTCHLKERIWTTAKWPGDSVRIVLLQRDGEIGSIRIQDYTGCMKDPNNNYQVGTFLPGETQSLPGDTPKTWPEYQTKTGDKDAANCIFDAYVETAHADGWKAYVRG